MEKGGFEARRKGFEHERDLARRLFREGFAVIRAPASGSRTKRVIYPDVLAIFRGKILIFEVKAFSQRRVVYIDQRRYERLKTFAERSGGKLFLAIKIIGEGKWKIVEFEKLERTKSGVLRCGIGQIDVAMSLEDLIKKVKENT
jgi:Holliday junction resolvase